jgi:hypothetical protein
MLTFVLLYRVEKLNADIAISNIMNKNATKRSLILDVRLIHIERSISIGECLLMKLKIRYQLQREQPE